MAAEHVLTTGGAGFIGSHFGDELLRAGYRVRALDSLVEQVHGDSKRPDYLSDEIELIAGDIRHCFADVTPAREALGFEADVQLEDGMAELAGWLEGQQATDRFEEAAEELSQRSLTR